MKRHLQPIKAIQLIIIGKTSESEVITEYVITKEDERSKKEVGRVSKNVYGESVNVFGEFAYLSRIPSVSIRLKRINERQIGQSWTRLNNSINKNLIVEMKSEKVRLQMNDWNYLTFVKRTSEKITFDDNQRVLVQWYLLVKSGYDAKVGYSNHHVHLLLPFSTRLYGDAYYLINKRRYYLLDDQYDISIRTYRKKYEGADKIFNLDQKGMELLSGDKITKRLKFQHLGKKYFINVSYNTALKDYYNGIPTTDLEVYFASSLSADIASQIKSQLRGYMRGMNQKQSVGFLLSFVQKGFGYKTDQQQFGKEKYFYPDEIFMYAFSDCEDRSVLFANLVEDMLGLKVIGVLYPNHVATAVRFTERVKGASVLFQGEKYTICDPTYIGAGPGKQMIVTKNENFEIISFKG